MKYNVGDSNDRIDKDGVMRDILEED